MSECLSDYLWCKGISLEELADQSKVRSWTINRWIKGEGRPQASKVRNVAKALGVTCEKFVKLLEAEEAATAECLALRRAKQLRVFLDLLQQGQMGLGGKPQKVLRCLERAQAELDGACAAIRGHLATAKLEQENSPQPPRKKSVIVIRRNKTKHASQA